MSLTRIASSLSLLAMTTVSTFAEEAAELPQEAQELTVRAEAVRSYRTRFTLEAKEETGEPVRMEGTLLFERPNRRRLELREGQERELSQLLVSDGTTEWQSYPAANTVYRLRSPEQILGPHRPFSDLQPGSVRFVERTESGKEIRVRFEAVPLPSVVEDSPVPIERLRVDVGEDGLVRELVLLDVQGESVLTQRYHDWEVNLAIARESFSFTPPDGFQVVDLEEPET